MARKQISINQTSYISELKYRILYSLLGLMWATIVSYRYGQTIIYLLMPDGISNLLSTEITDIFITYLNTASTLGIIIGSFLLVAQTMLFVRPGLYEIEATLLLKLMSFTLIMFFALYYFVYPKIIQISWNFFSSFSGDFISTQLNLEPHLRTYAQHLRNLGLLITFIGPILLGTGILLEYSALDILFRFRKIFYLATSILTAILTPPDLTSQLILSLCIIIVYEFYLITRLTARQYVRQVSLIRQTVKTD